MNKLLPSFWLPICFLSRKGSSIFQGWSMKRPWYTNCFGSFQKCPKRIQLFSFILIFAFPRVLRTTCSELGRCHKSRRLRRKQAREKEREGCRRPAAGPDFSKLLSNFLRVSGGQSQKQLACFLCQLGFQGSLWDQRDTLTCRDHCRRCSGFKACRYIGYADCCTKLKLRLRLSTGMACEEKVSRCSTKAGLGLERTGPMRADSNLQLGTGECINLSGLKALSFVGLYL